MNIFRDSTTYPKTRQQYIRWTLYPLPDPLGSFEDWQRFLSADVARMTPGAKWAENQEAHRALAHIERTGRDACIVYGIDHVPASAWLRERIRATRTARP